MHPWYERSYLGMHFSLYSSPNYFLLLSLISRVFSIVKPPGMTPIELLYKKSFKYLAGQHKMNRPLQNKNAVWH